MRCCRSFFFDLNITFDDGLPHDNVDSLFGLTRNSLLDLHNIYIVNYNYDDYNEY